MPLPQRFNNTLYFKIRKEPQCYASTACRTMVLSSWWYYFVSYLVAKGETFKCKTECLILNLKCNEVKDLSRSKINHYWETKAWNASGDCSDLPITLFAKLALLSVASPRSPIFTLPVGPVMKILSHFKSLWMMGGARVCRKWSPLRIWRLHLCRSFGFISLKRFRYLRNWDVKIIFTSGPKKRQLKGQSTQK